MYRVRLLSSPHFAAIQHHQASTDERPRSFRRERVLCKGLLVRQTNGVANAIVSIETGHGSTHDKARHVTTRQWHLLLEAVLTAERHRNTRTKKKTAEAQEVFVEFYQTNMYLVNEFEFAPPSQTRLCRGNQTGWTGDDGDPRRS